MSLSSPFNYQMNDFEYLDNNSWFQYGENINSYTDLGLLINKMSKPIMPQVQESTQDVPGMYGNVFMGNDYGEMTFTIPVTLLAFDATSYNIICENLRNVFTADSEDPGRETPIVFSDRPSIRYYGHWGQMSDPQFITPNDWQARATLTFICSQPYGYQDQEELSVFYPDQPILPKGNAKTYPIYRIHLKQDVYNVGFTSRTANGAYVATGYQVDDGNTDDEGNRIKDTMPLDTYENPTHLDDWITNPSEDKQLMTFTPNDMMDGKMGEREGQSGITPAPITRTDKNRDNGQQAVLTKDYGNPDNHTGDNNKYYGPMAIHPQFNNPTQDWRLMVNLWNKRDSTDHSSDRAMGGINVYLLDENGHRRGRIELHDAWAGYLPTVGFNIGPKNNETKMLNAKYGSPNGEWGPQKVGNYNYIRKRRYPTEGVEITSLYEYKKLVKVAQKAKKRKTQGKIRQNKKTNARRRYRKRRTYRRRRRR